MAQPFSHMSNPQGTMSAATRKANIAKWQGTTRKTTDDDDLMKTQARPATATPAQTAARATTTTRATAPASQNAPTMRTQTAIGPEPPPAGWTWNAQTSNWTPPATGQNAPTMSANTTPTTPPTTTPTPGYRASPYDWKAQTPNVSPGTWRGKGQVDIDAWQQRERDDIAWRNSLPQATRGQSIDMAMKYLDPAWTAPPWLNRLMEGEAQSATVPGYAYGLRPEYIDALLRTYKAKATPGTPAAQKYKEVEAFLRSAANANFQGSSPTVAGGMINGWPEWILRNTAGGTTPTTPPTTPGTPTMQPQPGTPPVGQYPTPTQTVSPTISTPGVPTSPATTAQAQVPLYNVYIPGTGTPAATPTQTVSPTVSVPGVPTSPAAADPAMQQYLRLQQYFLNGSTPATTPTPTTVPRATAPATTPSAPGYQGQWPIDITPPPPSYQGNATNPLAMANPLGTMLGSGVGAQAGGTYPWYGGSGSGTSPVPNPQPGGSTTLPTAEEIAAGNQVGDFLTYFFGAKPAWFNDPNWAANPTTRATVQAWVQAMQPYMQTYQNAYQYGQDFNEAQRRWNTEQGWQQQMDAYNAALTGRQQNMAEWQAQEAARQYQQTQDYQKARDAEEMGLARWQTNQQVWGRNVQPNVNWIRNSFA